MTNNSESHKELIRLGLATTLKGNTPVISLARKAGEIQRCWVLTVRAEEIRKKDGGIKEEFESSLNPITQEEL